MKNNNNLDHTILFNYENNDINKLIEQITKFGIIEDIDDKNLFDSKIEFEQKLVKDWLNNKNFKTDLLFRKSRDGFKPKDFHDRCDNKGITVTFIETMKEYKFGGYTELQLDQKIYLKKINQLLFFLLIIRKNIYQEMIMIHFFVVQVMDQFLDVFKQILL